MNITDKIRKYLYTPITLFALRKSTHFNSFAKFIFVEGLPVASLFLILGFWHGGRPKDILFGFVSTLLVLFSRAISKNKNLRSLLDKNNIFLEFFRFLNIIVFGLVLSIYDMPYINDSQNYHSLLLKIIIISLLLILINFYFRFKSFIYKTV